MNRQVYIATLVAVVFVESALSIPLKQYREISYNPCERHQIIKTPKTCTCESEDINLPEITFHTVDPSNDKFIQRILYHSQLEDLRDLLTSTDWSGQQHKNINDEADIQPSFRKNYFEGEVGVGDERFAALDPRLRQEADSLSENFDDNGNEEHLAALDPRLRQQQPDNSKPTETNNENPQQEAPLPQSEIPVPNMTLEQFRAMIDARSNDPNSVLSQGKLPNPKAVWIEKVLAGQDPRSPLDKPSTE